MKVEVDIEKMIRYYSENKSINEIARIFGTYPTTIRRLLEKNDVELRHDKKGFTLIKDGDKLIEWAKSQGRLVNKTELARVIGKKKLSPSYFVKYPELGQYVKTNEQKELKDYNKKLYEWLQKNNIQYKPNDRTKLKVSVTALLLGEYENIAIETNIKPQCVSRRNHDNSISKKMARARDAKVTILWLGKEDFDDLDHLKELLHTIKK